MKNVRHLLLTAAAVLLLGLHTTLTTQDKPLSQEQLETIAQQPATHWKATQNVCPEMLPLFKEESLEFGGTTRKYRLHVPENLTEGQQYPMILWLHGAGERGTDNRLQLVHLHHIITSLTGEKKRDFFLLVPQYPSNSYWSQSSKGSFSSIVGVPSDVRSGKKTLEQFKQELTEQTKAASPAGVKVEITNETTIMQSIAGSQAATQDQFLRVTVTSDEADSDHPLEFAFAMVEQVAKNYPVDRNRITVSGLSTGGDGTWRALERRPDLFAAAVPLVSWSALTDAAMEKSPILKKIPIWAIYSSDDSGIDSARADFERVEKAGANVKKTEFGICGHSAWTPAMLQADIFAWLLSRAKKGDNEFIAVFDPGVNPDDMKGIVDVATRDTTKPTLAPAVERQPTADVPTLSTPSVDGRTNVQARLEEARERLIESQAEARARLVELQKNLDPSEWVDSDGTRRVVHSGGVFPVGPVITPEQERGYVALAQQYFRFGNAMDDTRILAQFAQCAEKIPPAARIKLITELTKEARTAEGLAVLERLLDGASARPRQVIHYMPPVPPRPVVPVAVAPVTPARTSTTSISAARIIEECDRPWAMTSESLYGMFAADWDKESAAIPDFVISSDTDDLAKKLARSVGEDAEAKDFVAACKSILSLTNKPMSSPWFETSGGRLRSEISYSLSAKGQMFVRFLRTVKDSSGTDKAKELSKVAEKTLEKIDMVLAK